uniref:Ribosomal protein L37a n=1 Tax=Lynx canadensis TaxID=61383 RepID=A0A667GQW0_LYNCA
MAKHAKKVRIIGKYRTHYGVSLRKIVQKIEISQHYTCSFCGKTKMKRRAVGICHCGSCMKTIASGDSIQTQRQETKNTSINNKH